MYPGKGRANVVDNKSAYLRTQVLTARPEQLTLMLFDGAIRFVEQGRKQIEAGHYDHSCEALVRSQEIVIELLNGLRPEADPELCRKQAGLYLFVYQKLVEANMTRQVPLLDEALHILGLLRETWVLLLAKLQGEQVQGSSSARTPALAESALSLHG
jgi:flagellar protein FliS